jgi:hypothetical protein
VLGVARKAEWEKFRERSAERFGEDSNLRPSVSQAESGDFQALYVLRGIGLF